MRGTVKSRARMTQRFGTCFGRGRDGFAAQGVSLLSTSLAGWCPPLPGGPALFLSPRGLAWTLPPPCRRIALFAFLSQRTWGGVAADCLHHLPVASCSPERVLSEVPWHPRVRPEAFPERASTRLSLTLTPLADLLLSGWSSGPSSSPSPLRGQKPTVFILHLFLPSRACSVRCLQLPALSQAPPASHQPSGCSRPSAGPRGMLCYLKIPFYLERRFLAPSRVSPVPRGPEAAAHLCGHALLRCTFRCSCRLWGRCQPLEIRSETRGPSPFSVPQNTRGARPLEGRQVRKSTASLESQRRPTVSRVQDQEREPVIPSDWLTGPFLGGHSISLLYRSLPGGLPLALLCPEGPWSLPGNFHSPPKCPSSLAFLGSLTPRPALRGQFALGAI